MPVGLALSIGLSECLFCTDAESGCICATY